jgi:hypothetical protein
MTTLHVSGSLSAIIRSSEPYIGFGTLYAEIIPVSKSLACTNVLMLKFKEYNGMYMYEFSIKIIKII